jgi:Transposase DDE domain
VIDTPPRASGSLTGEQDTHGTFLGRIIARSLPEEAAQRARTKERKRARKQQRAVKEDTLFLCGWLLIFTSLPQSSWSDEHLLALYRARWQIELLIKRIKQLLQLTCLRGKTALSNEATLLALLLAWSLLQEEVQYARQVLTAALELWEQVQSLPQPPQETAPSLTPLSVSSWTTTALAVQTLRQVVQGRWTPARLRACLPFLQRFLCSRHRRLQQEGCIRRDVLAHPALTGASPSLLFFCSSA